MPHAAQVVKKSPKDSSYNGEFFSGDCYIILHTKLRGNALERDIFFWLGKDSSQVPPRHAYPPPFPAAAPETWGRSTAVGVHSPFDSHVVY